MLQLKFLNKDYGKKIADKMWPYFSAHGFFSKHSAPGYYSVNWSTYDGANEFRNESRGNVQSSRGLEIYE